MNSKFHEGKSTFTKDGNTIFFTRVQDSTGYIYRAVKSGGEWGSQVYISLNSDKYWIKDPCLSTDGKKMIFCIQSSRWIWRV
ncbi:MAG: hypothetical protein HC905_04760 [Bacteroidales bacterium]|nr:hypothetical protein [Bacteroidales bacterium]